MSAPRKIVYVASLELRETGAGSTHVVGLAEALHRRGRLGALVFPAGGWTPWDALPADVLEPVPVPVPTRARYVAFEALAATRVPRWRRRFGRCALLVRPGFLSAPLVVAARLAGVPAAVEINGPRDLDMAGSPLCRPVLGNEHLTLRLAEVCLPVTRGLERHYARRWPWLAGKTAVVPNGCHAADVDRPDDPQDRASARAELGLEPGDFAVIFTGSFAPWHRVVELALAVERAKHPAVRAVLVGGGEKEPAVRRIADRCARVRAIPWVPRRRAMRYVRAADLGYAMMDVDGDAPRGSPLKIFEYFAAGKTVLANPVDGVADLDGVAEHLVLCREATPAAIAAALDRAAADPGALARKGAALRALCAERYTWDRAAERIASLLDQEGARR